jgi:hypothetical protein
MRNTAVLHTCCCYGNATVWVGGVRGSDWKKRFSWKKKPVVIPIGWDIFTTTQDEDLSEINDRTVRVRARTDNVWSRRDRNIFRTCNVYLVVVNVRYAFDSYDIIIVISIIITKPIHILFMNRGWRRCVLLFAAAVAVFGIVVRLDDSIHAAETVVVTVQRLLRTVINNINEFVFVFITWNAIENGKKKNN